MPCVPACPLAVHRSLVLVIFIPLTAPRNTQANIDAIAAAGFLLSSLVQIAAVSGGHPPSPHPLSPLHSSPSPHPSDPWLQALTLFVCLDHERRYRSAEYAVSLGSSRTRCVAPMTPSFKEHVRKHLRYWWAGQVTPPHPLQVFSWARLGVVVQCLGSIGLLVTLEVVFKEQRRWVWPHPVSELCCPRGSPSILQGPRVHCNRGDSVGLHCLTAHHAGPSASPRGGVGGQEDGPAQALCNGQGEWAGNRSRLCPSALHSARAPAGVACAGAAAEQRGGPS